MNTLINLQDKILNVNPDNFLEIASEVFEFQSKNCKVYAEYLRYLRKDGIKPDALTQFPFLPAELFKYREIKAGDWEDETFFESSGTTKETKSKHHVRSLSWYHRVARQCFEFHYGPIQNYQFIGLLPATLERPNSSLISMFQYFMNASGSGNYEHSYLNDFASLFHLLTKPEMSRKKRILFGLSIALLDFAKVYMVEASDLIVIETGGMKSLNRVIDKETLIQELKRGFPNAEIHSEYGMTELMSQAYAMDGIHYASAPILKYIISDTTDPLSFLETGRRGAVNVIDLGNLHTCSFLQTGDLGVLDHSHRLDVLGRYHPDDIRGCGQMYE